MYGPPIINRLWSLEHPQVFEPGMVLAVESREGEFRAGGVRLENMIVITKDGAEIIDHNHILSVFQQPLCQMRPDKPRPARNQCFHKSPI